MEWRKFLRQGFKGFYQMHGIFNLERAKLEQFIHNRPRQSVLVQPQPHSFLAISRDCPFELYAIHHLKFLQKCFNEFYQTHRISNAVRAILGQFVRNRLRQSILVRHNRISSTALAVS
jgi:hypothetical protein